MKTGLGRIFFVAVVLLIGGTAMSEDQNKMNASKMILIGMDGLDPVLLEKFMADGDLPNFKKLASSGSFSRLGTSNPPQSPVAWSCLVSGTDPGEHDVFDFVVRDPKTYLPEIGMTQNKKEEGALKKLFSGLTGPNVETRRKGRTFWDDLSDKGISSVILRCPVTFPAQALQGKLLSGMGTPDIRGTQGISSFFTTRTITDKDLHGRIVPVEWKGKIISTEITGPKVQGTTGTKDITVPLEITNVSDTQIRLKIGQEEKVLNVGQWSDWFRLKFKVGMMADIYGIVRFQFKSMSPDFELFMTPVNLDPQAPAMPISYPTTYVKELFQKMGNFYTQGMPYDTWALNENRLSEEEFLHQAYSIYDENYKTLKLEMDQFNSGVLFAYFGITDLVQHMFWRYLDKDHPNPGTSKNPEVKEAIRRVYMKMDGLLGEIEKKVDDKTMLIVLSDHGFGSFRRSVHLNSWLHEKGFLVLKDDSSTGEEFFANVDWSQTRAYSVGFGGIYINQFGRERDGVVYKGAETEQIKHDIAEELKKWKDKDGSLVVKHVYRGEDLYTGPYASQGPDLFVGFNKNYRASWQTGLGAAPEGLIEDNMRIWTGDHLCDPSLVPGVILSNKKIKITDPQLTDINETILHYFGLPHKKESKGRPLY